MDLHNWAESIRNAFDIDTLRNKSQKQLYEISQGLPIKFIYTDGEPYLERYFLGQSGFYTGYLHRFVAGDGDRHLHNHPWDVSLSFILRGGYRQQVPTKDVVLGNPVDLVTQAFHAGDMNVIRANDYHQIIDVDIETWTVFVHTPTSQSWGFLEGDLNSGATRHRTHLSSHERNWWEKAPLAKNAPRVAFLHSPDVGIN